MTDQEILEGLGEIVEEIAGVPADEVTLTKSFVDDLDIDSLSMVEIAVAAQACERAGVAVSELSAFVPHQANLRIIESIARRLGVPRERLADDIVHAGNTSSASIPMALSRMAERGDLKSGSPALLLGFGAGLCYAAQVITVP